MSTINEFQGPNRFLSNFWPARVLLDGIEYPSVENAYQAAKTLANRLPFTACTAAESKKLGRRVPLRPDWNEIKLTTMAKLVIQKFAVEPLRSQLLATGDARLEEGNYWGDTYWGVCRGIGQNNLGKILMAVRDDERAKGRGRF